MDRRNFLKAGAGLAGALTLNAAAAAGRAMNAKAIAFDAFPIFDPRPVATLCEMLFPGRGNELVTMWRLRQFEYTWLRTVSRRYANFERVTDDALTFATKSLRLDMSAAQRERLLKAHFELKAWPDVPPALEQLRLRGIKLAFLSNFTAPMLTGCIRSAGLHDMFDLVLSTDRAQSYKPDPRAYQLGVDTLKLPRNDILFVAYAGWDAAGAKTFGYPTFWVNRLGLPPEQLGVRPDGSGASLTDLLTYLS